MQITKTSQLSGKDHTMELDITEDQVRAWRSGAYVQDAFPNLNADEREFLMTGITKEEWDGAFG